MKPPQASPRSKGMHIPPNISYGTQSTDVHMHVCSLASVLSNSLQPYVLFSWDSPGKNAGVGCHVLLQGIFPTQGSTLISCISCIAGRFFTIEPPGKPTHST